MKLPRSLQFGIAIAGLTSCGDPDSLGGAAAGASGSGGTSGAPGSGAAAGGGAGGFGGATAGSSDEVTLKMDSFVVQPGREVFLCQTFANPFAGNDTYLREFESHMTPGSHHLIVNYTQGAPVRDGDLIPCSGLVPPSGPFTTQSPDDLFTYPDGVAARLRGTDGLTLISHYYNSGGAPLTAEVTVTLRRARSETVLQQAHLQAMSYVNIDVSPRQSLIVQGGMTLPEDRPNLTQDILWLQSHMHSRGTRFTVSAGPAGENLIYETDRWEAPSFKLDPPYRLNVGDWLNYSCTFFNDGDVPLTFGESAANNEMCLLVYHYTTSDNRP